MKRLLLCASVAGLFLGSCESTGDWLPVPEEFYQAGTYVLYQGQYYDNIAGQLDVFPYDLTERYKKSVFQTANGRSLGATPQCGVAYGSKIYVGTYESNTIEIFNAADYKSISQIRLEGSAQGQYPRSMVAEGGKVYVAMYDGYVARIDTAANLIDASVKVGPNPEDMALHNGKLYVPNSDGMNWQNGYGTTASVVTLTPFATESEITVPLNPYKFLSTGSNLFLICKGDYYDVKPACYRMETDGSWTHIAEANMGAAFNNRLLLVNAVWQANPDDPSTGDCHADYIVYDADTRVCAPYNMIFDRNGYPNGVGIDPNTGFLFVSMNKYLPNGFPSYTTPGMLYVCSFLDRKMIAGVDNTGTGPACIFFPQK